MACNLKVSTDPNVDFEGAAGSDVTLQISGPAGTGAEIVHVRYAGTGISAPPFKFTIKDGTNLLVVVAEATKAGALLKLMEDCGGGNSQALTTFHFDPENPARGFFVKAV